MSKELILLCNSNINVVSAVCCLSTSCQGCSNHNTLGTPNQTASCWSLVICVVA